MWNEVIAAARENPCRFKMAAATYDKAQNKLTVGLAWNSLKKTHPLQKYYAEKEGCGRKIYLHAEISAIVKSRKRPYYLFVARVTKAGDIVSAKPCPICMRAIKE